MPRMRLLALIGLTLLSSSLPVFAFTIGSNTCAPTPITIGVIADSDFNLTQDAHVGWVRETIRWREVNPSPSFWDFSGVDAKVNAARAKGLEILAILSTAPQWAGGGVNGNTPPTNTAYWQEFVKLTAQRYNTKIAAYEIWNEPDLQNNPGVGIGWDRSISQSPTYADYLRIAATEIRTWAPGTLVVAPVTSSPNSRTVEIFQQIQNTNSSQYVDVVSFHANGTNKSLSEVYSGINSRLSTIVAQNPSNASKPIWITEMGWRSGSVGEAQQSSRIQSLITEMRGDIGFIVMGSLICGGWSEKNFTHSFIFLQKDVGTETAGIYRSNNTAKPVVTGYLVQKPFPATHVDEFDVPFSTSCAGRTCTFTSSFTDPLHLFGFTWDFGDGAVVTTPNHQVIHTFAARGRYFVKYMTAGSGSLKLLYVP